MGIKKPGLRYTSTILILIFMGLFAFWKRTGAQTHPGNEPYKKESINFIYNLLFCDSLDLYKNATAKPYTYPYDILFSGKSSMEDLQKVIDDPKSDPRIRALAYNKQLAGGHTPRKKEILAVIVEIGLNEGLDVLASFNDGTARYINHTEKMIVWEKIDDKTANAITSELFSKSMDIVKNIGPWHEARRPYPKKGNMRISFLVSDGFYFGEGPSDDLFGDPMAGPALAKATELMQYLTQTSLERYKNGK